MGSRKQKEKRRSDRKEALAPKKAKTKSSKPKAIKSDSISEEEEANEATESQTGIIVPAEDQLRFFVDLYQSANAVRLSSLELNSIDDRCILELSQGLDQSASNLGEHMKTAFGSSWKEVLCEKQLLEGKIDPGNPALLVISISALRSLELLRGLRSLTRECPAAKLFSKHMKIEDQVSFLKNRVNFACGTPSRIKKLIDMEALGLTRLAAIVLDMHTDVKGYSLFTLPQVRHEFWDLYQSYFHQKLVQGNLRMCLYGPLPDISRSKKKDS
ncbi:uncharacterized protein LOC127810972 [Diospyros lotus]|uniref:uncharacterized protein LOC127810972 n=1 Tax=Diospyros lotus TaxID=55363 RepID=UPI00225814B7|nr:uncharacterized protein LOC127810972 [Diospyros lotus]